MYYLKYDKIELASFWFYGPEMLNALRISCNVASGQLVLLQICAGALNNCSALQMRGDRVPNFGSYSQQRSFSFGPIRKARFCSKADNNEKTPTLFAIFLVNFIFPKLKMFLKEPIFAIYSTQRGNRTA
jgi:hypothetical protein